MSLNEEAPVDSELLMNDLGPLTWVLDELRKSVDFSSKALRRFARDAELARGSQLTEIDTGQLRLARQHLHQAEGALVMVGLPAPASLLGGMEAVVQKFVAHPEQCSDAAATKMDHAGLALTEYLEVVLKGKDVSPVALFPQYRDILELAGAERIHPADLWPGAWRWKQVPFSGHVGPLAYSKEVRARMDRAVLSIVKGGDLPSALMMARLCVGLAAAQTGAEARSFWAIAAGFFEALGLGFLPMDIYTRRTASRVLQQYAALAKGETHPSERLGQDLAFFCWQGAPAPGRAAPELLAVRDAYGFKEHKPISYDVAQFGRYDPAQLAATRKRIAAAAETWSALAGGDTNRLKIVGEQFAAVSDSIVKMHPESVALARALQSAIDSTIHSGASPGASISMEVATAILYLEAAYDDLDPTDNHLAHRGARLAQRLEHVLSGGESEPLEGWMEELYRRVSERQTMGSVVDELRASLGDVEVALDQFFRNPAEKGPLRDVPGRLAQMRGVFSVLGMDQAALAALRMRSSVERFLVDGPHTSAPHEGIFETLGNSLGAMSLLIDMLSYQRAMAKKLFVFDEASGEFRPLMGRQRASGVESADVQPLVSGPASAPASAPAPLGGSGVVAPPGPSTARSDTRTDGRAASSAGPAGSESAPSAPIPFEVPAKSPAQGQAPGQAQVAAAAGPVNSPAGKPAPGVSPAGVALHKSDGPGKKQGKVEAPVDEGEEDDLRDIFLEEAREVVLKGLAAARDLAADPANLSEQTTLRRAFHTLKGSSRMVGLNEFGEAAWSFEQMLNAWLAEQKPASDELITLSSQGMQAFGRWIEDIARGDAPGWSALPFRNSSDAMRLQSRFVPLRLGAAQTPHEAASAPPVPASVVAPAPAPLPMEETKVNAAVVDHDSEKPHVDWSHRAEEHFDFEPTHSAALLEAIPTEQHPAFSGTHAAPLEEESIGGPIDFVSTQPVLPGMLEPVGRHEVQPPRLVDEVAQAEPAVSGNLAELDFSVLVPPPAPAYPDTTGRADHPDHTEHSEPADRAGLDAEVLEEDPLPDIDLDFPLFDVTNVLPEDVPHAVPEGVIQLDEERAELSLQDAVEEEQVKVIGSLRLSIPFYNVFLNEADEWSRRLQTELGEWALELNMRAVPETAVALAHSLSGSSGAVGFTALSKQARLLEHALEHVLLHDQRSAEHAKVFNASAEDIRRLLHQFAAGFLKESDEAVLKDLQAIVDSDFPVNVADDEADQSVPEAEAEADELPVAASESAPIVASIPAVAPPPLRVAMARDTDLEAEDRLDPDLFPFFQEEVLELMPALGTALRQWVANPADMGHRSQVLRALHTLKGSSRLAGAMRLGEMAHRMESGIEELGSDGLQTSQLEPLLARYDALQEALDLLSNPESEIARIPVEMVPEPAANAQAPHAPGSHASGSHAPVSPAPASHPPAAHAPATQVPGTTRAVKREGAPAHPTAPATSTATASAQPRSTTGQTVRVRAQLLDRLVNLSGEVMISRSRLEGRTTQMVGALNELGGNLDRLRGQLRDIELQAESQMQSRLALTKDSAQAFDPLEFDRFTRVQELTRMMAESVNDVATVQRNLRRIVDGAEDDLVAQARQTRELQRDLLRTRMVEFEVVSDRLYGVVRQSSKEAGKQVRLDIEGGSFEMDRGVLERMTSAFEHILRNAVAHGIEPPAERVAAEKPPIGSITIRVNQEGNDVSVAFSDDGGGLKLEKIRAKAIANKLITPDQPLSGADAANLLFMPGFSTADEVTELSGRGIGMDVVLSELKALGGRVETSTEVGHGTTFKLILPLTTAVTQVVMLRIGTFVMGVPSNLMEVVLRVPVEQVRQAYANGTYPYDGEELPFFWAGALLQIGARSQEADNKNLPVAVFRSAGQRIVLHVDEVLGNREVVVKNLGPQLARLPGLAGMSVLASGSVVLIYNPVALTAVYGEQARALQGGTVAAAPSSSALALSQTGDEAAGTQVPLVLVVDDSITVRRVTQRLLKREGYRVTLANDGVQAMEKLREEKPSVVLSDIEMPRMDGFELVRAIRADDTLKDLPVIMITSRIAQKHRDLAVELGVDHYLGKPYAEDELLRLIGGYCNAAATAVPG